MMDKIVIVDRRNFGQKSFNTYGEMLSQHTIDTQEPYALFYLKNGKAVLVTDTIWCFEHFEDDCYKLFNIQKFIGFLFCRDVEMVYANERILQEIMKKDSWKSAILNLM